MGSNVGHDEMVCVGSNVGHDEMVCDVEQTMKLVHGQALWCSLILAGRQVPLEI